MSNKYISNKLCPKCGSDERYTRNNECVPCKLRRSKEDYHREGKDAQRCRMYRLPRDFDFNQPCYICNKEQPKIGRAHHVDHCHDTGKVRGVLCHNCNIILGFCENSNVDVNLLLNNIQEYLANSVDLREDNVK